MSHNSSHIPNHKSDFEILTAQQGAQEYLNTDYFSQMNLSELQYRLQSLGQSIPDNLKVPEKLNLQIQLQQLYTQLTRDFTSQEVYTLRQCLAQVFSLLKHKAPGLIPNYMPLRVLKLRENVDWNYPYTINHAIVLPQHFVRDLVIHGRETRLWNEKMRTLCHEIIHILQRNREFYPGQNLVFNFIYEKIWGFHKINKLENLDQIYSSQNILTNPDGYNFQYLIPIQDSSQHISAWILPVLIRDLNNRPKGLLMELYRSQTDGSNHWSSPRQWEIDQVPAYHTKFYGLRQQLYHPHEISSHLIADYVILNEIKSSSNYDFYRFYNFINKYLISKPFLKIEKPEKQIQN